jgi:hypothetical protein
MPTWFNNGRQRKKKLNIKPPPHAHVLDPTQKKPKDVGILGRGLKKKMKKTRGRVAERSTDFAATTPPFPQRALLLNSAGETSCA